MKANVVANQWPWSLRDVFADTASTCSISRHCSPSSLLAEPQQSINNVKAWAVLQIKASFADDFRARPIVNEEKGFVAENPMCFCTAAVSLDVKPRPSWNNHETLWLSVWGPEGLISRNSKSTLFLHSCDWGFKPYISSTQISWNKHSSGLYKYCSKEFGIRHYFSISKGTLALLIYRGKKHSIPWFTIVSGLFSGKKYIQIWLWAKTRCTGEGLKLLGNVLHPSASHVHLCWR